jgi:hypothetical protein
MIQTTDITAIWTGHNIFVNRLPNNAGYFAHVRTPFNRHVGTTDVFVSDRDAFNAGIEIAQADRDAATAVTA